MFPIASNSDDEKLYSDSVFSTYLYTGTNATQTITNGIDLAGKGGLVWIKRRTDEAHYLFDTNRGALAEINSDGLEESQIKANSLTSFNSDGFSLGSWGGTNYSVAPYNTYASWTFRKAAKFFDVVTYTGNGNSSKIINHNLNCMPGMIIVKTTASSADWVVCNRYTDTNYFGRNATYNYGLNTTSIAGAGVDPTLRGITTTSFDAAKLSGTNASYEINIGNASGQTYVAYLFAHDTSADGIIQGGGFMANASGIATVTLGWQPQYLLVNRDSAGSGWQIYDTMKGWPVTTDGTNVRDLYANLASAETNGFPFSPTATGFTLQGVNPNDIFTYMAIRMPNKPPTSGTQVYNAISRTGTGAAATVTGVGFAPDIVLSKALNTTRTYGWHDKLRGNVIIRSDTTAAEANSTTGVTGYTNNGITIGIDGGHYSINNTGDSYINHFFKRAPGFFDEVCYTGKGSGVPWNVPHSLASVPELIIVKNRTNVAYWRVYVSPLGAGYAIYLNSTDPAAASSTVWNNTSPTTSVFSVGDNNVNNINDNYVAYLFATLAGISKVGSYTGNGGSQAINCGFTAGARFVLIKRTDSTGDWYTWDTTRGIVTGNDPHLSLNTTAAEVTTDDSIDPYSPGFAVNQVAATNINVTSATYIFLAIS